MKVLALELSSGVGSVAFREGEETRDFRTFPADRKNSALFYESLQAVYRANPPPDLIAVGLGPGSYAGVRIAIATALGLRASSGAQLRGVPSICALELEEYLFVGDARRSSFVVAQVRGGWWMEEPALASEEEVRVRLENAGGLPVVATEPLPQFGEVKVEHPSALRLAELAPRIQDQETLEPIYLRPPHITTPRG
ncbi:MAG: tRNA (adenosine(37)-N6)-threonylcarbamoyltransferase complex dimerization subunit type 1 TsaB [Chthoniobacterales bacterium]